MKRKYSIFYENLQINVFGVTYTLSVIFIFYIFTVLVELPSIIWWVLIIIFYITGAVILWAHLFALFTIPRKLLGAFDAIKNDISRGKINDYQSFSNRLLEFLIQFYSFSFFDIVHAAINIKGEKMYYSSDLIKDTVLWSDLTKITKLSVEQIKHGTKLVDGLKFYIYTTPIWFGDEWLG